MKVDLDSLNCIVGAGEIAEDALAIHEDDPNDDKAQNIQAAATARVCIANIIEESKPDAFERAGLVEAAKMLWAINGAAPPDTWSGGKVPRLLRGGYGGDHEPTTFRDLLEAIRASGQVE